MPTYDYVCRKCKAPFSITEGIAAHGTRRARCPACGSRSVERMFGAFFAKTSKKS